MIKAVNFKKIVVVLILVFFCLIVTLLWSGYFKNKFGKETARTTDNVIFAIIVDGQSTNSFPEKADGYVGNASCNNGAIGV